MKLDMFTLLTMLCIANFIQFIIFFIQYRVNKRYHGVGFWVLGYASMAAGHMLLFLRGFISVKLFTIISANSLILLGWIFLYLGIMRFIGRKENRSILFTVFTVFILSFIFYTYFNEDIKMRTAIIYSAMAIISLLTAQGLFACKNHAIKASLNFNFSLFIIQSCFYAYRPFDVMIFESFNSLFTPTMMQTVSFLFIFIEGIMITFGLIVMINQRMNSEMREDKESLELFFNTNPDSVLITRLNDGIIVKINDGFTLLTGFTGSDVIGKSLADVCIWTDPADRQKLVSLLTEKGFCYNLEYVFRRKDESQFNGLVSARLINLQGIPHIISVTKDVTDRKQSENLLNQTRQNYETFFNAIDDFLFVLDEQGNIIHTNSTVLERLGYTMEELIGKSVLVVHPPERREEAGRIVGEMLNGTAEFCPVPVITKAGVQIPVETRVSPGFWDGKPVIFGVTKDISKIKLSEEKFSKLFYINPSACGLTDLDDNKYIEVNDAFYALLGFDRNEVIGKTARDLGILAEETIKNVLQKADSSGNILNAEADLKAKNGEIKHVLMSAESISVQDKKYRFTVVHDITDRKRAEEALRESELKYRSLIENTSDVVFCVNEKGEYQFANSVFASTFGQTPDYFTGKTFWDVYPKEHADYRQEASRKVFETGESQTVEVTVPLPDRTLYFLAKANPIKDENGKVILNLTTATDITERKTAEEALRKSEEQIRSINNNMQSGMIYQIVMSKDGSRRFTYLSDSVKILYGITPEEGMADPGLIYGKVHKDDIGRLVEEEKAAIKTLSTFKTELRTVTPSGDIRWAYLVSIPKALDDGTICFDGIEFDITERKHAENELSEVSARLSLAVRAGGVGVWDYDIVNNNLLWDDQMFRLYGITRDMFSGVYEAWQAGLHPEDKARGDAEIQRAILGEKEFNTEFRVVWPDGSIHNIRALAVVYRDNSGQPLRMIGTNWDITAQKQAEEALRDSEEKLSTLFGSMTEMVVLHELIFNEQGDAVNYRITDCNNAFTEMTGIKKENAAGMLATDLYPTEFPPYLEEYTRVALSGIPYEYTTYFEPMDKHFSISVVSPKKNNFATITTDITEVRKVQEVISAKNKELENYLYIASHDLRSPLVNIQGFSRRLQKQTDSISSALSGTSIAAETKEIIDALTRDGIPKTLNYIFSSVKKMDTLLNGLLNVSRTGRTVMNIDRIDSNKLFKTIIGNYNFQLTEIDAVIKVPDLQPCYGDENLLNQLFSNIIGNAIKYRDKNRKLTIEITSQQEFRKVVYSIRDNGLGIDPRHINKIWDVFYRVDSDQGDAGEGLGLSIVRRIAEKHNGSVRVDSEPGSGSVFHVELQNSKFPE